MEEARQVLRDAYGLEHAELSALTKGANNLTLLVESEERQEPVQRVLRVYRNHANLAHVQYELDVMAGLAALEAGRLSFAVSEAVPACDGKLYAWTEEGHLAVLFRHIEGARPDERDLRQVEAVGAAFGELSEALQAVKLGPHPVFASYYEFDRTHPSLTAAKVEELVRGPVFAGMEAEAEILLREMEHVKAADWASSPLPRQTIHGDLALSNVLSIGAKVTGILDFEFAGQDLRAMDFVIGLAQHVDEPEEMAWPRLEAYVRGYGRTSKLSAEEIAAVPDLILIRLVASFVHRLGRCVDGLDPMEAAREHLRIVAEGKRCVEERRERLLALCTEHLQ